MFYDIDKAIDACDEEPSLVFEAIKCNYRDVYEKVLEKENFNFNLVDEDGNNILMKLLKNKDYDLIAKYVNNMNFNINHQNNDGDTFMHILVTHNYVDIKVIFEKVLERSDFLPNIKNNNNESILDKSINDNYIYTVIKILSDKRFNSISLYSFKKLYEAYIKSNNYGTYSKLNNYVLIFDKLIPDKVASPDNFLTVIVITRLAVSPASGTTVTVTVLSPVVKPVVLPVTVALVLASCGVAVTVIPLAVDGTVTV